MQELIAPRFVDFYAFDGSHLGSKTTLIQTLVDTTGISIDVLRGQPATECGINERFRWARERTTKRAEDRVYSLFGIFGVNMPLIYGEGEQRALARLYEQISKLGKK